MKKIIFSLAMIAAVSAAAFGATRAFFNDTEKSTGNTFTAGTIDISVDGQNPWNKSWSSYLDKPMQTNYMNFMIKNSGENPANVWKKLDNVVNGAGVSTFCSLASSEPEFTDGGGIVTGQDPLVCGGTYVERDNLSAFMIYDMSVCVKGGTSNCACATLNTDTKGNGAPIAEGDCWKILIDEADQVRVDNIAGTWLKIADNLAVGQEMVVSQSYKLMTWDDSGQPMITNWAQGDTMSFDITLDARQIDAPAPGTTMQNNEVMAEANLVAKNTTTWDPIIGGANGKLTYRVSGDTFKYTFTATGLTNDNYQLVYYPDPWSNPKTVTLIGGVINVTAGTINTSGDIDILTDLPNSTDANYPAGAKIWLVPASSLSGSNLSWTNLNQFLFDASLVNYSDTNN